MNDEKNELVIGQINELISVDMGRINDLLTEDKKEKFGQYSHQLEKKLGDLIIKNEELKKVHKEAIAIIKAFIEGYHRTIDTDKAMQKAEEFIEEYER